MLSRCLLAAALLMPTSSAAQKLTLQCAQQSRTMCTQGNGCQALIDEAPNQWSFELPKEEMGGFISVKATRCSGGKCSPPFEIFMRAAASGELFGWEPLANEAFSISPGGLRFSHSLTANRGDGGHIVSEFGYCRR